MRKQNSSILFSPSDLVRFVQSPFASWMERLCLEQPQTKALKDKPDPLLSYLADKGLEHEANYLSNLVQSAQRLVTIGDGLSNDEKIAATIAAMEDGADVIFQACLAADSFQGFADFLVKVDKPSKLGSYSYEPWDTKLAKQPKAYFIIQLCCYADLLKSVQGVLPDNIAVVLGTQEKVQYSSLDFWAYYQAKKTEFINQQSGFDPSNQPDPFAYKDLGDWTDYVEQLRQQQDHLSKIANITRLHIQRLNRAGINTCEQLINNKQLSIGSMPVEISERLKHQAKLQKQTETTATLAFELLPMDQNDPKGLAILPPHDQGDLFFDLEGFPLEEGGLEYLWGCSYFDTGGKRQFWERWAHDHQQEKTAFIDFAEFAYKRWRQNPSMHIYHYGHYEISVCKRLMGRYGVMETQIDDMLRAGVFVDLYKVIQHGMILGAPSYSIKKVEQLFREQRDTDVASGGESVVVYAKWQETPDGQSWQTSKVLCDIRDYNIDDCNSTQELTAWLRELQKNYQIEYVEPFPVATGTTAQQSDQDEPDPVRQIETNLRVLADAQGTSHQTSLITNQLADLVDFFSRENKPTWWRFFERKAMSFEELFDDPDCLVGCERTATDPQPSGKSGRGAPVYEYQFIPSQEFRNRRFKQAFVLERNIGVVGIENVDDKAGLVWIKGKRNAPLPDYLTLISYEYINPGAVEDRVRGAAIRFTNEQKLSKPLEDFLLRRSPALPQGLLQQIDSAKDANKLALITQAVCRLDNSFLSIQGPPGTGKTYTASHVILELLQQGKSIGVSSNSHKAINNLMSAVAKLMLAAGLQIPMYKVQQDDTDEMFSLYPIQQLNSRDGNIHLQGAGLYGATAWGFAQNEHSFDYLFIDEAGQVSVAYLIAMAKNANNIVVMGDQMQLPQPLQGSHPGDSSLSILDYQLQEHATVPIDKGVFLNRSYRMHSAVNQFISEMVYEGRLDNDANCDRQHIHFPKQHHTSLIESAGIIAIPLDHSGNKQSSAEEVALIRLLVDDLLKSEHTDKNGNKKPITGSDILVVAPFNHQVNELKKTLGFDARVGTVDLFQGQEAPVVIVSMTASIAAESARGADFLLSINRLNVAISRAQALAIVVYSETLLQGSPSNIEDIKRFSFFQQLVDL
ncbi:TM0106 family RecB-like putative nuclease [Aliiglaciecola sp. LCG003]|uniref:TM0106 family RecB-like putative nuclease n=1 Tax=Aliiglaciecola sp. LCG003 TaxID=3053655 RepID=UPI002572FC39|nr:TM0106 family RecB-like putative nuclease [Aliiglaciecola sp. LCG003]WJG08085.1 TM0106 family RecB-like putative nuclease [Aliiglaciecola sp. LCG003]